MYCHKCGAENKPGSTFCKKCGVKLKQNNQQVQIAQEESVAITDCDLHNDQNLESSIAQAESDSEQSEYPIPSNEGLEELQAVPEEDKPKSGANVIIISVVTLVVLIGGYLLFAYKKPMWPFAGSSGPEEAMVYKENELTSVGDLKAFNVKGPAKCVEYYFPGEDGTMSEGEGFPIYFDRNGMMASEDVEVSDEGTRSLAVCNYAIMQFNIENDKIVYMTYGVPRGGVGWELTATKYDEEGRPVEFDNPYSDAKMKAEYSLPDENGNWTKIVLKPVVANPDIYDIELMRKITYYKDGESEYVEPKLPTEAELKALVTKAEDYDTSVMTPEFAAITQRWKDSPGTSESLWAGGFEDGPHKIGSGVYSGEKGEEGRFLFGDVYGKYENVDKTSATFEYTYYIYFSPDKSDKRESENHGVVNIVLKDGKWQVDNIGTGGYRMGFIDMTEDEKSKMQEHLDKVDAEIRSGKLMREIEDLKEDWAYDDVVKVVKSYKQKYNVQ